jgi:predicted acylesterase/phospholipase RssA
MRSTNTNNIPYIPPRRLLFSGGGIRVVSYLGVIQVLEEKQFLNHVMEYCGVSAGGLVALMLALGYKLSVIERFCYMYDFSNVRSVEPENAFEFLENYGIDDGQNLEKLLHKILYYKGFGSKATFKELKESGRVKSLRIWASDIQHLKPIEFSAEKTPNIEVVFALRASMCIPMYFMPLRHPETGTFIVDGGVFDNYPISCLSYPEREDSLGITFEFNKTPVEVQDFSQYLSLITNGYYRPSYQELVSKYKDRTIVIPCAEHSALDFEASKEDRQLLVSIGRQATEDFFKKKPELYYKRRNSVS